MSPSTLHSLHGVVVDDEGEPLSAAQLGRAFRVSEQQVEVWVVEGVLAPAGASRAEWRFGGTAFRRLRAAERLQRDLEINAAGVALALDLLDRIAALESRLRRVGLKTGDES